MKQLVIARAQPGLMPANFADDEGDQVFVICRDGGQKTMRKEVELRRPFYAWVDMEFAGCVDETEKPKGNKK